MRETQQRFLQSCQFIFLPGKNVFITNICELSACDPAGTTGLRGKEGRNGGGWTLPQGGNGASCRSRFHPNAHVIKLEGFSDIWFVEYVMMGGSDDDPKKNDLSLQGSFRVSVKDSCDGVPHSARKPSSKKGIFRQECTINESVQDRDLYLIRLMKNNVTINKKILL